MYDERKALKEMPISLDTQAMLEIARFFASQPTPEEIMGFHASPQLNNRLYALIAEEKSGMIDQEGRRELDAFEAIEHILIHTKAEARRKLRQRAS